MPNKRRIESYDDWFKKNGGEEQEQRSTQPSHVVKPSQKFAEWYQADEVDRLRQLAAQTAAERKERSAWLKEFNNRYSNYQSDAQAYNDNLYRHAYASAVSYPMANGAYLGAQIAASGKRSLTPEQMTTAAGRIARDMTVPPEERTYSVFKKNLEMPDNGGNVKYYDWRYSNGNWSVPVSDGGENVDQRYINQKTVRSNFEVPDGGDRSRRTEQEEQRLAPEVDPYEARRAALDEFIRANRNMNSVTGSYVMDDLLGYTKETSEFPKKTVQNADTTPKHIQAFDTMSSADIKERQDHYNEMVASDLTLAKNLLAGTFAGVEPARSQARDELGAKWGINAYDAEELRLLADRLERGVIYTDGSGKETTWDKLYNNALNREKAEASILPPEEQAYVQSLYAMSSDELAKKYGEQDDEARTGDLSTAEWLLTGTVPWFEYDENSDVGQARKRLADEYGIDPTNENDLRTLIQNLKVYEPSDVIYTDTNGRNYTYQDLYYNAENREKFNQMETDEGALNLLAEGLKLQKQIDQYNSYIVDAGTAAEYAPMITDLGNKKALIENRLNERGYDLDRMIGYLNTEDAKQRFIMQSQATAAWTEEHPVLANIASMLATPIQAVEWMGNNTGSGNPEDLQNYVPMNYFGMEATNFSSTVRGTTSNMIQNEMLKAGFSNEFAELASETYSGVLSATQSRILALACDAMFGPLGEVAVKGMTLAIMGSASASETLRESIDRGLDNKHAIITAASAGIAEAAFEEISLDRFLQNALDPANLPKNILDALKKSQLQRIVEGSEEFFTDIANTIADGIINGDMSEYNNKISTYMAQNGGDRAAAVKQANKDFVTQLLQSAFGGYIGGGGFGSFAMNSVINSSPFQQAMSPFNNAYNQYQQNRAYQNVGSSVIENQNVGSLVEQARAAGDKGLRELADQVAEAQILAPKQPNKGPIIKPAAEMANQVSNESLKTPVQSQQNQQIVKPTKKQQKEYKIAVGKLATETAKTSYQQALGSSNSALRQTIESELKNRGVDIDAKNIDVVAKLVSGQELNYDDKTISNKIHAPEIAEMVQERASDIEAEASRLSQEAFKRVDDVRKMVNTDLSEKVSETGEVINIKTGKAVEIDEIKSVKQNDDGTYTMRLGTKDGDRVKIDDIQFADPTQATLYTSLQASGLNPETSNAIIRAFDGKGTASAGNYIQGMMEGLQYGRTNQTADMDLKGPYFAELTVPQKNLAIQLGKMENEVTISKALDNIANLQQMTNGAKRTGSVTGVTSKDAGLNNAQRTGIRAIEMLVDNGALTNNFHFFSSAEEGGRRVLTENVGGLKKGTTAPNGFYDAKTGDIYIDVNAGNAGEGTVLFTAAHELTHFVKQWSPNKFNDLANFLVQEYGGAGVSVDQMVRSQMQKAGDRNLSYDDAFEEMVADSMQTMFTDGNLAEKLLALKERDKTLFDKIMDFVKKLQKGIAKVYSRYEPESAEAKALSQIKGAVDRLADTFAEGINAATENYSEVAPGSGIINISDGDNKGATILSVRDLLGDKSKNKYAGDLVTRFGVTKQEAMDWLNAETSLASIILNPKYSQFLDYIADPDELAVKKNSDYPQGTVDFSNICAKRREFTDVMNRILRQFPNHVFAATDLAKIRTIMSQEGMKVPCGLCYVEDRRQLDSIVAQDFIDAVQRYREGNNTRADGKPFNRNQLKGLEMMGSDTHTPSIYELISTEGRNKLKAEHPNIEKAWVTFNNARGMQSVRLLLNDAEYKREILKYNKKTVQRKNDHGGLRIYSFSDMEMFHLIDIIQVLTDCSIKGVYVQGYTKVNEYAKAVRNTGEKLNRSLIPLGDLGYHMENGKVVLDYDTVEGIDINSPDFFDSKDNPNIGNITIGINDTQIRAAMTSDFVDMIIPFHTGQSREVLGEKGIAEWQNYKDYQTDKDIATGRTSKHQINIYTEVLQPMEKAGVEINKRTFVEKFLEVCKENGLTPRFAQFLNTDANGNYVYTEGYHKMLVDFKTFAHTETGEYLPQGAIRPIFDNEYLTSLLKNYVKEQQTKDAELSKSMPKVVGRIANEIVNQTKDIKLSARDQEYMDAVNNDDMKAAQKLVDKAAKDAGYSLSTYHGTGEYFNVFKLGKEGIHLGNEDVARQIAKNRFDVRSKNTRYKWSDIKKNISKMDSEAKNDLLTELDRMQYVADGIDYFKGDPDSTDDIIAYGDQIADALGSDPTYRFRTFDRKTGENVMKLYAKMSNPFVINGDILLWSPANISDVLFARDQDRDRIMINGDKDISGSAIKLTDDQKNTLSKISVGVIKGDKAWSALRDVFAAYGYDGIQYKNEYEGDKNSYSYIALNPSDVKLADPVTYDDAGNVIPLSERFNHGSADIRYSTRDSEGNTLTQEQQEYFKDSKIRDEDGNLLVVYHGTDADFTVFDKTKGRSTMDIQGMFFSPWEIDAAGYGSNVQAYYLNIKNPAPEGLAYKALNLYKGQNNAGVKARNYLEKKGYDGVNNGNEEFIAFNSEQIKKVDNKKPTSNPDIRFSERDPDAMDTRTVLSNALLETAQNDAERNILTDYQSKIQAMNEQQNLLNDIREEIKHLTFDKTPHTQAHLKSLREEAKKIANRINIYDKQLLKIESMKPIGAVVERERAKVKARIQAQQDQFMTDYKNKVTSREYISCIEHEVKGLRDRLLHPKAKTVIPESFAKPVSQFLSRIDFTTFYKDGTARPGKANATRAQLLSDLQAVSDAINDASLEAEYGQLDLSPDMKTWIDDAKAHITSMVPGGNDIFYVNRMSTEGLKNLYKIVAGIRAAVNSAGKMYTNMSSDVTDIAHSTIDYLRPLMNKGKRSAVGERAYQFLGWDYAQPVTVFDRFGDGGKQVFKMLMKGQDQEAKNVQTILDFVKNAYTKKEINSWREEMHDVKIGGSNYKVPTSYIQELYCMLKDTDARRHILEGGGIRFDELTTGKGIRKTNERFEDTFISYDEAEAMIAKLTPRQKEVADKLQEFMDRIGADWGNKISMVRFGYHAFGQIPNYYPIKTVKRGSEYEAQQKRANIYALLNKSFTKERTVNANNAVIIGDIFETFANHMSEMAIYNAWALPVIDTIKWFNYKEGQDVATNTSEVSVKNALRVAYGERGGADQYVRKLLESINGQRTGGLSEAAAFFNMRFVNRVAVAANVRVAVQQPFSITRAFELISPKYVRPMTPAKLMSEYREMVENSAFGRWKDLGYYDVNISKPLEQEILKNERMIDALTDKSMFLAEKGDQFTWATLWHACKLEAVHKGLSGKKLIETAAEKFNEIIARTQVVDSVLTKSQWMREGSFWYRMTSAFMSEPMTSYNTLLRRFDKYQRDVAERGGSYAFKNNFGNIVKTSAVFLLTQIVNALVTSPIDAMRDDDDYKTFWEKMMENFKESTLENINPAGMMPYVNDVVEYLKYKKADRPDMAMVIKLVDSSKKIYSYLQKIDSLSRTEKIAFINNLLNVASSATGLPMYNAWRDFKAIWNTVVGDILDIDYGRLKWQSSEDVKKRGYEQVASYLRDGNETRAEYVYMQILSNYGDDQNEVDKTFKGVRSAVEDAYDQANPTEQDLETLERFYKLFGVEDAEGEADFRIAWREYAKNNPESPLTNQAAYKTYYEDIAPSGIDIETYAEYYPHRDESQSEQLPVIDSLPITDEQKDFLYLRKWSESTIEKNAPWKSEASEATEQSTTSLSEQSYNWYVENAEPQGIDLETYETYHAQRESAHNIDYDGDGKTDQTKQQRIIEIIDSLDLTNDQKDFLYLKDYAPSGLSKTPWH